MSVLASIGTYVPHWRLSTPTVDTAWGSSGRRGRRSVADRDEDAITLAVQAATSLPSAAEDIDTLVFTSTSAPYLEKQNASVIATVLGLPTTTRTMDLTGSRRAWLSALALAADLAAAGGPSSALVLAGDVRPAEPHSPDELAFGDAGGAAVVRAEGEGAEILAHATAHADDLGSWRTTHDVQVRHGEQRFALGASELEPARVAVQDALARAELTLADVSVLAVAASSPALAPQLAKALRFTGTIVVEGPEPVGYTGTSHAALALATALDHRSADDIVVAVATGDGADALVLRAGTCRIAGPSVADPGENRDVYYASFLRARGLLPLATEPPRSSSVAHHRDAAQTLHLDGMVCKSCDQVQYPITDRCAYCESTDCLIRPLARTGRVRTFTADHIVAGINPGNGEGVVTMAVVDLDGGGRVFVQCTSDYVDVALDDRVDLVLRHLHDGSGFKNYYWKATKATEGAQHGID